MIWNKIEKVIVTVKKVEIYTKTVAQIVKDVVVSIIKL